MKPAAHPAIQRAFDWLSSGPMLEQLDPHDYRAGYLALHRLFAEYVDPLKFDTVLAGANAVYGWMPTILKNGVRRDAWQIHSAALSELKRAKSWPEARQIIAADLSILRLINGSVVGTSKFLHFLSPNLLPIWDSRIGKGFGAAYAGTVNSPERYVAYTDALSASLEDGGQFSAEYYAFVGEEISPIRKLELLLFLHAQSKARNTT